MPALPMLQRAKLCVQRALLCVQRCVQRAAGVCAAVRAARLDRGGGGALEAGVRARKGGRVGLGWCTRGWG